jgi:hypothetical protein
MEVSLDANSNGAGDRPMTTLYKKVGRRYKPVAEHEEWDSCPKGARAAIAKATGEQP